MTCRRTSVTRIVATLALLGLAACGSDTSSSIFLPGGATSTRSVSATATGGSATATALASGTPPASTTHMSVPTDTPEGPTRTVARTATATLPAATRTATATVGGITATATSTATDSVPTSTVTAEPSPSTATPSPTVTAQPGETDTPSPSATSTAAPPTPSATTGGATATFTATATPSSGAQCGNHVLEPGETCEGCPTDCAVQACTGGSPTVVVTVDLVPPLGEQPTTATVLVGYDNAVIALPGSGSVPSVRQRIIPPAPLPQSFGVNDLDYAVRVVVSRNMPLGRLVTATFDRCQGAPAPVGADFACTVEGCAAGGAPVTGCSCTVTLP
jgi:hypothetical protein